MTAPVVSGEEMLRPILDAFLDDFPEVSAKLMLIEQHVSLIDEGIDVALRMGHLLDSTMLAVRVGAVRRAIVAAPSYLASHPPIEAPGDLMAQQIITMTHFGVDSWSFPPAAGSSVSRAVQFRPRFVVDSMRAAVASAIEGYGVTRVFSYLMADPVREGRLQIVLGADEDTPVPVHLVIPDGRLSVPKVRAFIDFAVPRLRAQSARLALDGDTDGSPRC